MVQLHKQQQLPLQQQHQQRHHERYRWRQFNCWLFIIAWLAQHAVLTEGSWGAPGQGQYHIQTDEGPERYFRFQTDNGQFRKEKRLQDGTVIGTEAWIDAAGYLRQKDYIADKQGYRILKSKTVYVGEGRGIEDAIKSTKSVPAQSGVLVDGANDGAGSGKSHNDIQNVIISSTTSRPTLAATTIASPISSSTTPAPTPTHLPPRLGYLSPAEAAKLELSPYLGFDHYPDELPRGYSYGRQRQPLVHIRPHSEPIDLLPDYGSGNAITENYIGDVASTTARPLPLATPSPPSIEMAPPLESKYRRLRPIAVRPHSTPAPIAATAHAYSTPAPFVVPRTTPAVAGYHYAPAVTPIAPAYTASRHDAGDAHGFASDARAAAAVAVLPLDVNNLEGGLLPPLPPTRAPRPRPNELYDGVSDTRNGFRYYLPRHYHEEEQVDEKRAGSYGYVDPFGIRRVVYYNAAPGRGFVHRNNNRYVGLGGTPYDP